LHEKVTRHSLERDARLRPALHRPALHLPATPRPPAWGPPTTDGWAFPRPRHAPSSPRRHSSCPQPPRGRAMPLPASVSCFITNTTPTAPWRPLWAPPPAWPTWPSWRPPSVAAARPRGTEPLASAPSVPRAGRASVAGRRPSLREDKKSQEADQNVLKIERRKTARRQETGNAQASGKKTSQTGRCAG